MPGRPFAAGPRPPIYTPYFVFAGIERSQGPGVVGYGRNSISANFSDTLPWNDCLYNFDFPAGSWSVDDDLLGYVFRGCLLLMTTRGMPVGPNPLLIPAEPM